LSANSIWELGRRAREGVVVDATAFQRYLDARPQASPAHAADLYLACACSAGDSAALLVFERELLSQVEGFVARIDRSRAFAQEVQQIVRERLFVCARGGRAKILDYDGRGSLKSWLRVVAVNVALELLRTRKPQDDDEAALDQLAGPDPELAFIRQRYARDFGQAFADALAALSSPDRLVLRLYLVEHLGIDEIGALCGFHRSTAARRLAGARLKLFEDTRERLRQRLKLSDSAFRSLLKLVQSSMDVSVRRILLQERLPTPKGGHRPRDP
jgi:RNA polymerase sigma-70 factor, ECF subfamily